MKSVMDLEEYDPFFSGSSWFSEDTDYPYLPDIEEYSDCDWDEYIDAEGEC